MGRILFWTVLFFVNLIYVLTDIGFSGVWAGFWFGIAVYGLCDAIATELDNREFMYERLGIKDKA